MRMAIFSVATIADKSNTVDALIVLSYENSYQVHVTVGHVNTSWDHHVDQWQVISIGGEILGTRARHCIGERLFLRIDRPVTIPPGVKT